MKNRGRKKGRRKSVWRKNVLEPLEVANAHFSWLQAATKTKPNRFQRSLRNLPSLSRVPSRAKSGRAPRWVEINIETSWDKLMWSWASSPATSSEPTPSLEPDPSQAKSINGLSRASSQAGTQAKLSRSPSLNHAYRARPVLCSRLSLDEPSRHRSNPRAVPSPNKPKQNPEPRAESLAEAELCLDPRPSCASTRGRAVPRPEAELCLDPRPSLASSQAPSPEESLRIKPSYQTPNRSPSRDADTSFEQSWAKYRASNLVRAGLIPEFSRTSSRASPNQASSQDELSLETSRAIPREPNRNPPNRGQNWSETSRNDPRQSCVLTHQARARPSQAELSLNSQVEPRV